MHSNPGMLNGKPWGEIPGNSRFPGNFPYGNSWEFPFPGNSREFPYKKFPGGKSLQPFGGEGMGISRCTSLLQPRPCRTLPLHPQSKLSRASPQSLQSLRLTLPASTRWLGRVDLSPRPRVHTPGLGPALAPYNSTLTRARTNLPLALTKPDIRLPDQGSMIGGCRGSVPAMGCRSPG